MLDELIETIIADNVDFSRFPDVATLYSLDRMARTSFALGVTFYLTSSLDQAVTVQAVGHQRDAAQDQNGLINVGNSITLGVNGRAGMSIDLVKNRYAFYGLTVTTGATAPTVGRLDVIAQVEPRLVPESDPAVTRILADMVQLLGGISQVEASLSQGMQTLLDRETPSGLAHIFGQGDRR